jgi:hypothetical protein
MKTRIACVLVVTLAALAGCKQQGTPGGPGATSPTQTKPIGGQADDTFTLSVPSMSTSLKQGETKTVTIGINRGKNFDGDVTLKFGETTKGLAIDPTTPVIKHGDADAKITLKAADDATLGDSTVKVHGHPTKGAVAANEFKVTINHVAL